MKAISVKEPWASRIAFCGKTIETRTWPTNYRGKLLICASKTPYSPLAGKAACVVDLVDCRPMTKEDEDAAQCAYYPGAWAWVLKNVRLLRKAIPVRGRLGLFEVEEVSS